MWVRPHTVFFYQLKSNILPHILLSISFLFLLFVVVQRDFEVNQSDIFFFNFHPNPFFPSSSYSSPSDSLIPSVHPSGGPTVTLLALVSLSTSVGRRHGLIMKVSVLGRPVGISTVPLSVDQLESIPLSVDQLESEPFDRRFRLGESTVEPLSLSVCLCLSLCPLLELTQ